MAGPTVIIRLSQFNLTKFGYQLELSLAKIMFDLDDRVGNFFLNMRMIVKLATTDSLFVT